MDMDTAIETSERRLGTARAGGDASSIADALLRHADMLLHAGRLADAERAVDEATALHQARGATLDESRCLRLGATLGRLQGRLDDARLRATKALGLANGRPAEAAAAQVELGEIALARGDAPAALEAFDAALASGAAATQAAWHGRAKALAQAGRFEAAAADLEALARLTEAAGDPRGAWRTAIEAATAWQHARRFDKAEALVLAVRPGAAAAGDEEVLAGLALLSATQAIEAGQLPLARLHASAAREHALASRAAASYIGAAVALSRIDEEAGDRGGAYAALATGWATLGDLLGPELARAAFEPLLRRLRAQWGVEAFDAARRAYEAPRRAIVQGGVP